jgi:opacity protein-like surface antigen
MKTITLSLFVFLLGLSCNSLNAQRFSFLAEAGGLRAQIDGDKIQGFYYNGYTFGIGSNYTFTPEHFLAIKTTYYNQGSRRKSDLESQRREGIQLEVDLNTIGLELTYKYDPVHLPHFYGLGFVRHQLIDLDYEIVESQLEGDGRLLDPDQVKSGFNSLKFYYGVDLFKRASIYASMETSVSNILSSRFFEVKRLVPYSIAVIFSYEIFAAKEVVMKKRPGSKSRTKTKIKGVSKKSPFAY